MSGADLLKEIEEVEKYLEHEAAQYHGVGGPHAAAVTILKYKTDLMRARIALEGKKLRDGLLVSHIDNAIRQIAKTQALLKGEGFYIAAGDLDAVLLTLDEAKHKFVYTAYAPEGQG